MAGNYWKLLDMARNCYNGLIWLDIFRNGWKWLKMARKCWNGRTWLEMAGNGLKWDGLITVLVIWGVWDIQSGALAGICWNRLEYAGIDWNRLEYAGIG